MINFKPKTIKPFGAIAPIAAILIGIMPFNSIGATKDPNLGEAFLGNPNAKVVLIEYGSLTCGHCADLAINVMPTIKQKYVDTNKIKFVYRPLPTQPAALAIGLQVIADCAGGNKRYDLIDEFYHKQNDIFSRANNPNGPLKYALQIAKARAGLDENKAKSCLQNDAMIAKVQDIASWGDEKYKITGTPTLLINGKDIDPNNANEFTIAFLSAQIDKALGNSPPKGKKK